MVVLQKTKWIILRQAQQSCDTTLKLMFKERTLGVGGWAVVGVLLDTEEMPTPTS